MYKGLSWTPLHARLQRTLKQRQLLPANHRLLIAFSGGQDSLCLLRLLLDLRDRWRWDLAVVHCDHRWPPDSTANARYAAGLVRRWSLPFFGRTAPSVLKGEAEGREWRYQEMAEIARENGYTRVLTAHTASDRTETLLYNLVRGSGADGLQALTWQRPLAESISLIRPLLEVTRAETGNFCQDLGLPVWQDAMNQDLHYRRNRIRQDILPYFREHFNPKVDTVIAQTAELLHADVAYLESSAQELLRRATISELDCERSGALACLERAVLQRAPLALQRRAVRQFLQMHLGLMPNFAQIEKVTALISAPNRSRTDPLRAEIVAEVSGTQLCLCRLAHP